MLSTLTTAVTRAKEVNVKHGVAALTASIVTIAAARSIYRVYRERALQKELQAVATKKRKERDERLYGRETQVLDAAAARLGLNRNQEKRVEILKLSLEELLEALKQRRFTAEEVVVAFCLQAREVCGPHTPINAITETYFEDALEQAKEADRRYQEGQNIRSLEGIPITVKDHIDVKGKDSTMGMACSCFKPRNEDGVYVKILRDEGAIVIARSNVPQLMCICETTNRIFGRTTNPWDPSGQRSAGGSSGGEGALVSARASVIGLGTDIGGSIRLPSAYCGGYGMKPTPQRLTLLGVSPPLFHFDMEGNFIFENVRPTVGPISNSMEGLHVVMKSWLDKRSPMWKLDSSIPKVPWKEATYTSQKKLKIGYFIDSNWLPPSASSSRAVHEAVEALKRAGHEVIPFEAPPIKEAMAVFFGIFFGVGGHLTWNHALRGEEPIDEYKGMVSLMATIANYGRWTSHLLEFFYRLIGEKMVAETIPFSRQLSVLEMEQLVFLKMGIEGMYSAKWKAFGLDAVICPVTLAPALLVDHAKWENFVWEIPYTMIWNLIHFPAGNVPVTVAKPDEDKGWKHYDGTSNDSYAKLMRKSLDNDQGLPVGVQVVALPFKDEKCMRVMKDIAEQIRFNQVPPTIFNP
eukprot:TRINITY_DN8818_c0_g1_i1.p1 TRINITY_DN8818_c0_g1~~TRINITY_DN8818_c0_g1_i1.p1  ORF type:complete len:634 (+),score=79.47 TRINITY_DN8818_c0_g1_i1:230-2131(+)